jgi:hypothetical protein
VRRVSIGTAIELLHDVFWPEFVEVDGCVFLAWLKSNGLEHKYGRTETEASENHTHMIDLFNHKADHRPIDENDDRFYNSEHPDFKLLCEMGKALAEIWFRKLMIDFPSYDFRVYYTQNDNPIVRFHRVRLGETNWLDKSDWPEAIERGEIIIYDTRAIRDKQVGA